ncbi:tetratricopeptide repeat protein [Pseudoneobacillus sp. C159]
MEKEIARAIDLRKSGHYKESNDIFLRLVKEFPDDAFLNYQCAWSHDVLGEESNAVPYYENAIKLGLSGSDLEGALLGLGSTYRTLGEYEKSRETLVKGTELFPNNRALQVFYSMTLYNLKEHDKAMEILLKNLTDTSTDPSILKYKRAIDFYSDQLDQIWE